MPDTHFLLLDENCLQHILNSSACSAKVKALLKLHYVIYHEY